MILGIYHRPSFDFASFILGHFGRFEFKYAFLQFPNVVEFSCGVW